MGRGAPCTMALPTPATSDPVSSHPLTWGAPASVLTAPNRAQHPPASGPLHSLSSAQHPSPLEICMASAPLFHPCLCFNSPTLGVPLGLPT